jgi:membrane protein YqaA with SNARE-associated domain
MFDIGGWMYSVFGPYGAPGILIFIFLIFFIDAVVFPTLPELFFIIGYTYNPTPWWGLAILLTAMVAEAAGVTLLYLIVEKCRMPASIKKVADKYIKFLIVSDERMVLVNRVAPMVPFLGAFASLIDSWSIKKVLFYNAIGCIVKYGFILLMSGVFYAYFSGPDAEMYTIIFVIAIMVISLVASILRKKKVEGTSDEDS